MTKFKYTEKAQGESTWINSPEKTPEEYVGFVYRVTNLETGEQYVGMTHYWKKYTLPPLKGQKNRRHFLKEMDWRHYNTSGDFKEDIINNPNKYKKEIIHNCKTLSELKGYEAYIILKDYLFEGNKLINNLVKLHIGLARK